jgi:cell division septal protein FtsQ
MDRSLAARTAGPFGTRARGSGSARARAGAGRRARTASVPWRGLARAGALRPLRLIAAAVLRRRRLRVALLVALISLPLLVVAWRWLRHSSLVAVQRVQVSGLHGPEARAIEGALAAAARHMSTLDVKLGALRSAVAPFRVVREVHASPSFPHALRIRVVEQLPVAALLVGGSRTAVAADGVVLGPALLSSSLPTLSAPYEPAVGTRVGGASLLAPLAVLGAAPAPLARVIARAFSSQKGLTIVMRNGLFAYFGDASRPHAKWLSLARVLADPNSAGAVYVDVRVPERAAAGFPAGVTPPAQGGQTSGQASEQVSPSEPTVAALAAGLTKGTPGASTSAGEAAAGSSSGSPSSSSPGESGAGAPAPAGAAAGQETPQAPAEPSG